MALISVFLSHHFANGSNKEHQASNYQALPFLLGLTITEGPFQELLFSNFKFLLPSWG